MDFELKFACVLRSLLVLACAAGCDPREADYSRLPYPEGSATPLSCVPNLDGKIESNELAVAYGVPIHDLVSPPNTTRTVDVAGAKTPSGIEWDLSVDYADDREVTVAAVDVSKKWYGPSFPAGSFATPLDPDDKTEDVGTLDDKGLWLLGIASSTENPKEGKTLLIYQQPIQLVQFPIAPGQSFVSQGEIVNGVARGLPYAGQDTYEVSVDALGQLVLPSLTFSQVQKVSTHVTVEPAVGAPASRRQVSFFFECFGEVTRVISQDGETQKDFTAASRLWRIGF